MTTAGGKWQHYLAVGEEAARGTAEKTTLGFIPIMEPFIPIPDFNDQKRMEYRGEDRAKGPSAVRRFSGSWSGSFQTPVFTEAGTVAGMIGTLFKHFFGKVTTAQNASTGQYYHMYYPSTAPYDTGATLVSKALTFNSNFNKGATIYNHPYVGGRMNKLTLSQEAGQLLMATFDVFGQYQDIEDTAIASPTFAAENLGLRRSHLLFYNGSGISRTGTGPDYTAIAKGTMNQVSPESLTFEITANRTDEIRFDGAAYPTKTICGEFEYALTFKVDWEIPSSGFSSPAEWISWYTGVGNTPFLAVWDTGVQAGTGDNHSLIIDFPIANRIAPTFDVNTTTKKIELKYEGLVDLTTTTYGLGMMLKNTASAV